MSAMCLIFVCQPDVVVQSFAALMRSVSGTRNRVYNIATVLRAMKVMPWRVAAAYRHPAMYAIIVACMPPVNPPSVYTEINIYVPYLFINIFLSLCAAIPLGMSASAMPVSTAMAMFVWRIKTVSTHHRCVI